MLSPAMQNVMDQLAQYKRESREFYEEHKNGDASPNHSKRKQPTTATLPAVAKRGKTLTDLASSAGAASSSASSSAMPTSFLSSEQPELHEAVVSQEKVSLDSSDSAAVQEVRDEIRCKICLSTMVQPYMLCGRCSGSLCAACIHSLMKHATTKRKRRFKCPTCRNPIMCSQLKIYPNRLLMQMGVSMNIESTCPECNRTMPFRELRDHLKEKHASRHRELCPTEPIMGGTGRRGSRRGGRRGGAGRAGGHATFARFGVVQWFDSDMETDEDSSGNWDPAEDD